MLLHLVFKHLLSPLTFKGLKLDKPCLLWIQVFEKTIEHLWVIVLYGDLQNFRENISELLVAQTFGA